MSRTLRVLFVEDSDNDVELIARELRSYGYIIDPVRVEELDQMREAVQSKSWDVILCDYYMPRFDAIQALKLARNLCPNTPFLIVSGSVGEDLAVEAMQAGAHDYIMKNRLARLAPAIEREMKEAEIRRKARIAEEKLRAAERLYAVGQVASSILHDLKNPMQIILGYTEFLKAEEAPLDKRQKCCEVIAEQVDRMLTMSKEVLDFARGNLRVLFEPTDLPQLFQEIADSHRLTLERDKCKLLYTLQVKEPANPRVMLDKEKIRRVVINLIDNARYALKSGGELRLDLRISESEARFQVTDTGSGIPEHVREHLFEPFFTYGKEHGTGLGLLIVKSIVDAHGGTISVDSTEGVGTTFTITIPQSQWHDKEGLYDHTTPAFSEAVL